MSKKVREVPVILGSKGILQPSIEEIKWMLRAADSLILSGGRTLLTKILKGSKEKTGDPKYIPLLMAWEKIDYKKVQSRIRQVISSIAA